jgi:hypothetical protein
MCTLFIKENAKITHFNSSEQFISEARKKKNLQDNPNMNGEGPIVIIRETFEFQLLIRTISLCLQSSLFWLGWNRQFTGIKIWYRKYTRRFKGKRDGMLFPPSNQTCCTARRTYVKRPKCFRTCKNIDICFAIKICQTDLIFSCADEGPIGREMMHVIFLHHLIYYRRISLRLV